MLPPDNFHLEIVDDYFWDILQVQLRIETGTIVWGIGITTRPRPGHAGSLFTAGCEERNT